MKIAIITLFNNGNIGASLQAYALNRVLTRLGHNCEDLKYVRISDGRTDNSNHWRKRWALLMTSKGRRIFVQKSIFSICFRKTKKNRKHLIRVFEQRYLPQSRRNYKGEQELLNADLDYDCYICGSDNIWNINKFDPSFMLSFVRKGKKLSYAAGFSTIDLSEKEKETMLPLIKELSVISVRELSGLRLLNKLLPDIDIRQDIDPTMLLSAEEWSEISAGIPKLPDRYIFCYILGAEKNARETAKKVSSILGLPIVTIPHATTFQIADKKFGDVKLKNIGPQQFITLFSCADFVITDSFHGSIFSILNRKQFIAFRRFSDESKDSNLNLRLDSLFDSLGIKGRIYHDGMNAERLVFNQIEYDDVMKQLDSLKEYSMSYLQGI